MKIISGLKLCLLGASFALIGLAGAAPPTPVSNVQVTLKGKKYQIDDVTTVSELQERLEEQSGIAPSKQGKILHNGKRLSNNNAAGTNLSEAGVSGGDQLNCVPSKKSSSSSSKKKSTTASVAAAPEAASAAAAADGGMGDLQDMISKMMSGAGMGGGGMPDMSGGMPDMAESMKMMKELTASPLFSEYMNNPDKLEESRQAILNNPMMKSMMSSMPGMSDLLDDKESWAAAMQAAAGIMQSMDPEDMMKMMEAQGMGGGGAGGGMQMPPGMGGMGGGLFDGAGSAAVSSALDELSEGED